MLFRSYFLVAVRMGGSGDVTASHQAYKIDKAAPYVPTPVVVGDRLYMVSDLGIASCVEASTGRVIWSERIPKGNCFASPVFADARVYFLSEEGECTVIAPGQEYRELARNQVAERTLASLAISDRAIFLRGERSLYRIEKSVA